MKKNSSFLLYTFCLVLLCKICVGKHQKPDSVYFNSIFLISTKYSTSLLRSADNQKKQSLASDALEDYTPLRQKYSFTYPHLQTYWTLAILAENPKAFKEATVDVILQTGTPLNDLLSGLNAYMEDVYNFQVSNSLNKPSMKSALNEIINIEDSLLLETKRRFDWNTILLIQSLLRSDQDFRSLPDYIFEDSNKFYHTFSCNINKYPIGEIVGMKLIDSANFTRLYQYIKTKGFPPSEQLGYYGHSIWLVLWHCTGLFCEKNKNALQKYIDIWKFVLPVFYQRSLTGDFNHEKYQYIYNGLIQSSEEYLNDSTTNFFKKFLNTYP